MFIKHELGNFMFGNARMKNNISDNHNNFFDFRCYFFLSFRFRNSFLCNWYFLIFLFHLSLKLSQFLRGFYRLFFPCLNIHAPTRISAEKELVFFCLQQIFQCNSENFSLKSTSPTTHKFIEWELFKIEEFENSRLLLL